MAMNDIGVDSGIPVALKSKQRFTAPKIDCRFFGQPNSLVSTGKPRTFRLGVS
jgi:hypothetical protein